MTEFVSEDLVTRLNTQLNKSMALMDDTADIQSQYKHRKSIKINTKILPLGASNSPVIKSRKSILKKSDSDLFNESQTNDEATQINSHDERLNKTLPPQLSHSILVPSRPHNLQELVQKEILDMESISSESFNLNDISDNEDIWIMDIPKSIDPQELHGQTIRLGDKSKIKIKKGRYYAVTHNVKHNVTCVFNTGKEISEHKIVNVKPTGLLTVRRKLSGELKMEPIYPKNSGMPLFPHNLKKRHPLFGVTYEGKVRRKSKKRSSFKKKLIT